ncbi:MAG: outer membrane protein assembly factor BamA [Gammaproteobacteria bacterium]|nr:MAG: outer membrane protein assembly factor BamA [Gammaproteobacteria bacterium]
MIKKTFFLLIFALCFCRLALGEASFVVSEIKVEGLQRISAGTVFNYLPIKVGDRIDQKRSAEAIRTLFKTGFFKDVRMEQQGTHLVVHVVERPAIFSIEIKGNKDLSTEDLLKGLKGIGLAEGRVFNQQLFDKVQQELRRQYFSHGKYGLKIETEVTPLPRNRVSILVDISEGRVAKIKQINIVGNETFDDERLLKEFEQSTPNIASFYTKDDQYSKQKLSADLERLRSFYLNRGYINFLVDSTQVSITPDKKEIYITINVTEGDRFMLDKVKLTGDLIVNPDELFPLVRVSPGDIFSRREATETSKALTARLGVEGFVFANVNMVPEINEENKTVDMTFYVDPGKRVYVRRINMLGNTRTRDEVIRREMRQMESAVASTALIELSKLRLNRLGYFEQVNVETPAVPGTNDQIDVQYSVEEKASGNLMGGVGFSQSQGIIFNASVTQNNVLGTGKRVSFALNKSESNQIYNFGYLNPYHTVDGISRGFDIRVRQVNTEDLNVSNFSADRWGFGVNYGIPLGEFDTLRLNFDFLDTTMYTSEFSSDEVHDFVEENGDNYAVVQATVGWAHDTRNRAVFATQGGLKRLSLLVTVPMSDLEYYKLSYRQQNYFYWTESLTFMINADLAHGDGYGDTDALPFFEHYYAGGTKSVRGYEDHTLGPVDSNGDAFGGSTKVIGNAEVIFPVPFIEDTQSIRLSAFFDVGNVFADGEFEMEELRYSVGLSAKWLSPFGALSFSIAQPINNQPEDEIQQFQFSFGGGF